MKRTFLLAALLLSALAYAQPGMPEQPQPPEPMEPPGAPAAPAPPELWGRQPFCEDSCQMNKERRMLEAVRVSRLTEVLKLTDEQIATFIPKLKQLEERQRQLGHQRQKALRELEKRLQASAKEAEIKAKLAELDRLEGERLQRMREMRTELDKLLSIEQQARWRVFNDRFDQEIRDMVKEIRVRRMGPHRFN